MKFYLNPETKQFLILGDNETADLTGLTEIIPNTVDAAREKHVPVISREGVTVTVTVGSTAHPMQEVHYIEWILLVTSDGMERKELTPGEEPAAQFYAGEDTEIVAAYAYCNLHGLWEGKE